MVVASKDKPSKKEKDAAPKKGDRPESKFTKKGPTVTGATGSQNYQRYVLQGDTDYNNINLIVEKNWDKVSEINVLTQAGLDATASHKGKSKPAPKKQDILIMYNKKNKPEICDTYSTDDGRQLNNNYHDYDSKKKTPKGKKDVRKGKSPSKDEYDSDTNEFYARLDLKDFDNLDMQDDESSQTGGEPGNQFKKGFVYVPPPVEGFHQDVVLENEAIIRETNSYLMKQKYQDQERVGGKNLPVDGKKGSGADKGPRDGAIFDMPERNKPNAKKPTPNTNIDVNPNSKVPGLPSRGQDPNLGEHYQNIYASKNRNKGSKMSCEMKDNLLSDRYVDSLSSSMKRDIQVEVPALNKIDENSNRLKLSKENYDLGLNGEMDTEEGINIEECEVNMDAANFESNLKLQQNILDGKFKGKSDRYYVDSEFDEASGMKNQSKDLQSGLKLRPTNQDDSEIPKLYNKEEDSSIHLSPKPDTEP